MKRYSKLIIAAIVALIFIGTFVFLWQKSQPKEVVYNEFTPKMEDIQKTTIITGKIEPRNEVNIKPQISGIITDLYKEPGDYVNAGDVIAKVKVIPDMGQLSSAEARVRLSEINSTLIRSTISGRILDIPVKVGNMVILSNNFNDGTTIASVANMNDLIFRGNIDETEVGQLVNDMPMKITIGALQDLNFEANLEYVSPKAVENNGANQFEIKAAVKLAEGSQIRSGYSANAEIVLSSASKVLCVPESAIEFSGDSTFVYVIKGEGKDKTYNRTQVTTGLSDGVNIEIKKGITQKDKVRGPEVITEDKEK